MAEITASAVKELRERSGAGMMDCKKALTETGGDIEAASDWLRSKGLAAAAKKSSRTAAEGLVGVAVAGTKGVAVEVNSQTDFVAKNEIFQNYVREVTAIALEKGDDVDALKASAMAAGGTVEDVLVANIATIGGYLRFQLALPALGEASLTVREEREISTEICGVAA